MLLLAVAWAAKEHLAGDVAAALLTALSCVDPRLAAGHADADVPLKAGIVVMAAIDAYLVLSDELEQPERDAVRCRAARRPATAAVRAHRPARRCGYGDLFVAARLGAILAVERRPRPTATALSSVSGSPSTCCSGSSTRFRDRSGGRRAGPARAGVQ